MRAREEPPEGSPLIFRDFFQQLTLAIQALGFNFGIQALNFRLESKFIYGF